MAVNFPETKTFLPPKLLTYADILRKNQNINQHEAGSSTTSTELTSCGSSSTSGLSTPAGTDFSPTESESDNDDFIDELTRQMADYMLQEEDDENKTPKTVSESSKGLFGQRVTGGTGFYFNQAFVDDQRRLKEVKNQKTVKYQGSEYWERRRKKISESTQKLKEEQQVQDKEHHNKHNKGRRREFSHGGRVHPPLGSSQHGSGMRVIFLGGSGSKTGSSGTGVFLPRGDDNITEVRKKPGCSTVLIPAKVLQALDFHFKNMDPLSPSNGCGAFTSYSTKQDAVMDRENGLCSQNLPPMNDEELDLPQEWTY